MGITQEHRNDFNLLSLYSLGKVTPKSEYKWTRTDLTKN